MSEITCLNFDCPERTGGECMYKISDIREVIKRKLLDHMMPPTIHADLGSTANVDHCVEQILDWHKAQVKKLQEEIDDMHYQASMNDE